MEDKRDPQTYAMIGACMEVHTFHGCGFHERIYKDSLEVECKLRAIPFRREVPFEVRYKGHEIDCRYFADFVCFDEVILEAKAVNCLIDAHRGQLLNYLKAAKLQRGLLVNFGAERLEYERIVLDYPG